ncbi:glucose-6-phosphate dehydrogenase [Thiothrix nivea]|uniref:Glucose-6-phosphate 1-dehydrogenase n=1 Tax=Thiothrix nivea (strain ATCC 35100 / DSM 5205 / JP2) TaxID=870187 RepID=A0A656HMM5_THINJ|nr:glucose-6-phosphate dehydrogenase [Thiothrix nivea]EIJ36776.1 glucose-6-phosphate 1-dehydrogenase [Thiothrix nivea DSM 5205]
MSCGGISHAYVIFGATGNLAATKLLPALYQLHCMGQMAEDVEILGCGRTPYTRDSWQEEVRKQFVEAGMAESPCLASFIQRLDYLSGSLKDAGFYQALGKWISNDGECANNVIFYLSVSPDLYVEVTEGLAAANLLDETHGWRRMVIEKPFGHNLESARALQHSLSDHLKEEQIYRIDHYVGKEAVQNLLVLRFANLILEPLWNRHHIDHIQITHAETLGVEGRANYYDKSGGAVRDMIQSHLLQVMALLAMEPPVSLQSESLRDEKVKVLQSIRPVDLEQLATHAIRGQYAAGEISGQAVPGYLQEEGVAPGSHTESYAAMKLYIDNWRWKGVPFYLRTGKRLKERRSMVAVRFRRPPMQLFHGSGISQPHPNWLLIGIQPEDAVRMEVSAKVPGLEMRTRQIVMDASVGHPGERKAEAYEELLLDVIKGDRSLFLRYDEVKAAWNVVDPVMQRWGEDEQLPLQYPAGGWGPKAAEKIFEGSDRAWRHSLSCNGDE